MPCLTCHMSSMHDMPSNYSNIYVYSIYWNTTVPERFHYGDNRRIAPIVGLAEDGWIITTRSYNDFIQGI